MPMTLHLYYFKLETNIHYNIFIKISRQQQLYFRTRYFDNLGSVPKDYMNYYIMAYIL